MRCIVSTVFHTGLEFICGGAGGGGGWGTYNQTPLQFILRIVAYLIQIIPSHHNSKIIKVHLCNNIHYYFHYFEH